MRVSDFTAQYGAYADHRIVLQLADGSFLEVDSVSFAKVWPVDYRPAVPGRAAEGDDPGAPEVPANDGNWEGRLIVPEDPERQGVGERVIVLTATDN